MTTSLRLHRLTWVAESVRIFELRTLDGAPVAPWEPGAHVDVQLPNGLLRQYSLLPSERPDVHRLGIKRDADSTGGSRWLFARAQVGAEFEVGEPRNTFAFHGGPSLLIGGGIGVTPLLAMAEALHAAGEAAWALHYAVRRREEAAFLEALGRYGDHVRLHVDDEAGAVLDLAALLATAAPDTHLYCCGPTAMLETFTAAATAAGRAADHVHVEYFSPARAPATTGGFTVLLARTGRRVTVAPGSTILGTLRAEGLSVMASCERGICGTCETTVLGGTPEHRDSLLSAAEQASGKTMMICCSGSLTPELTLEW